MLPSVLAEEVRVGVEEFLSSSFHIGSEYFSRAWDDFFSRERSLFRGPYYTLGLPFRPGSEDYVFPSGMKLGFSPYLHQQRAFERLCDKKGASVLIATGTGSGKTECFLYPLLDYCATQKEQGVKAIVVYPMNALATDQAKRFAKEIFTRPELKNNVTVGLFIGGLKDNDGSKIMTEDSVITCKDAMRKNPPDILLTNYKALDYLLVRAKDYSLWAKNTPGMLRYVVVDELHTFDGAQGADLACLLRRVYSRLQVDQKDVSRIGTSATLGANVANVDAQDSEDAKEEDAPDDRARLVRFASQIFGGTFAEEDVVGEDLLSPEEFLEGADEHIRKTLREEDLAILDPARYATAREYLEQQAFFWLDRAFQFDGEESRVELGDALKGSQAFRALLRASRGQTLDAEQLAQALGRNALVARVQDGLFSVRGLDETSRVFRDRAIQSLFSLISYARREVVGRRAPFLRVGVQLWLREVARFGASVCPTPETDSTTNELVERRPQFAFFSDIATDSPDRYLPVVNCRGCGRTGYLSYYLQKSSRLSTNIAEIYKKFFAGDSDVRYVYVPDAEETEDASRKKFWTDRLCPKCLTLYPSTNASDACPKCGAPTRRVVVYHPFGAEDSRTRSDSSRRACPICDAQEVAIVGSRAAGLTSVALSRIFGSQYNDDKKLLAFSDSVQDASYRAAFFIGRSFRFTLRAATQQFVNSFPSPVALDKIVDGFAPYYLERFEEEDLKNPTLAPSKRPFAKTRAKLRFIAQFAHPDLQDSEYLELKDAGDSASGALVDKVYANVVQRVRYEIVAEYGRLSKIGRTLEKSRCSTVAIRADLRERWIDVMTTYAREEIGLRDLPDLRLRVGRWIVAFARIAREIGAIDHDSLNLIFDEGNYFQTNRYIPFMPNFNTDRAPRFLQLETVFKNFESLADSKRPAKYANALRGAFGSNALNYSKELYTELMRSGEKLGIFKQSSKSSAYGFRQDALSVETELVQCVNAITKRAFYVAKSESAYWSDARTWNKDHERYETYRLEEREETDYYHSHYQRADICRIIAKEHTGLLEREPREELEREFIAGSNAKIAAVNTLSCTPTLEMGVNIGDLSTVALCSTPPSRASFVQRVGRGGRRDGNSFNLVLSTNQPRDLYYFNEPSEAFAGSVDPPGVFLQAPAVLERQLIAFSFDRWIEYECANAPTLAPETLLPYELGKLLKAREKDSAKAFPANFFNFVEERRDALFNAFRELFADELDERSIDALRRFYYEDGGFSWKILTKLDKTQALVKKYSDAQERLRKRIERFQALDEASRRDLDALVTERSAIQRAKKYIEHKSTYEYLTDEGLLPNYAFPEEGMKLVPVIGSGKKEPKKSDVHSVEFARPAGVAIEEFAPGNSFYADGRKLTINRIDASGEMKIENWHFCASCGYVHKGEDGPEPTKTCPKCGDASWASGENRRRVLRLERVLADQPERKTLVYDKEENRKPKFYSRKMLVQYGADLSETTPQVAYRLKKEESSFGFEYWPKAVFRDVNFGPSEIANSTETITVAGQEVTNSGFSVCKECGFVGQGNQRHIRGCVNENKDEGKDSIEVVHLYREFLSEALRLSIPFPTNEQASFVAATKMAFHEYFRGNVQHLRFEVQQDATSNSEHPIAFLVVYDQVPGGTGYLKEFASDPQKLARAFRLAYARLKKCSCQYDEEKDGCYRCLLEYRVGKTPGDLSRTTALDAIKKLLDFPQENKEEFEKIESIGKIDAAYNTESQLEKDFLALFEKYESNVDPVTQIEFSVKKFHRDGQACYALAFRNGPQYYLYQQRELGESEGVEVHSRVDFRLEPSDAEDSRPIAIFTDGYAYHAALSGNYYRLDVDASQRNAIAQSKKKIVCWSLTYNDVQYAATSNSSALSSNSKGNPDCVPRVDVKRFKANPINLKALEKLELDDRLLANANLDSFRALLDYLSSKANGQREREKMATLPFIPCRSELKDQGIVSLESAKALWRAIREGRSLEELLEQAEGLEKLKGPQEGCVLLTYRPVVDRFAYFGFMPYASLKSTPEERLATSRAALVLDDESPIDSLEELETYRRAWNSWLGAFNSDQFLAGAYLVSLKGVKKDPSDALPDWDDALGVSIWSEEKEEGGATLVGDWKEALEAHDDDPKVEAILLDAHNAGKDAPEPFLDLSNGREVVGTLDLAWSDEKVFWSENQETIDAAKALGWTPYQFNG